MSDPMSERELGEIRARAEKATPLRWKAVPLGGSSTIVVDVMPPRNDTRIPAYGYREENGYCLAYPFIEDNREVRLDFVCFGHADATFIAHARTDIPALLAEIDRQRELMKEAADWIDRIPGCRRGAECRETHSPDCIVSRLRTAGEG